MYALVRVPQICAGVLSLLAMAGYGVYVPKIKERGAIRVLFPNYLFITATTTGWLCYAGGRDEMREAVERIEIG